MTPALALHTAARRYCQDRAALWCDRYATLPDAGRVGPEYSVAALDIFPRFNVLFAIQAEVELLDPDRLPDIDSVREWLLLAGQTAHSLFTRGECEPNAH